MRVVGWRRGAWKIHKQCQGSSRQEKFTISKEMRIGLNLVENQLSTKTEIQSFGKNVSG